MIFGAFPWHRGKERDGEREQLEHMEETSSPLGTLHPKARGMGMREGMAFLSHQGSRDGHEHGNGFP